MHQTKISDEVSTPTPTLLERGSLRLTQASANVNCRLRLTGKAFKRGLETAGKAKAVLAERNKLIVNIEHYYGVQRCNAMLAALQEEVDNYKAVQDELPQIPAQPEKD